MEKISEELLKLEADRFESYRVWSSSIFNRYLSIIKDQRIKIAELEKKVLTLSV